jgi:hypothetical protein
VAPWCRERGPIILRIRDSEIDSVVTRTATQPLETAPDWPWCSDPSATAARCPSRQSCPRGTRGSRRQDGCFGQGLTDQPSAPCTERAAHGELALSDRRVCQQQVRDVRPRDQQQKSHRAEQDRQGRARPARDRSKFGSARRAGRPFELTSKTDAIASGRTVRIHRLWPVRVDASMNPGRFLAGRPDNGFGDAASQVCVTVPRQLVSARSRTRESVIASCW